MVQPSSIIMLVVGGEVRSMVFFDWYFTPRKKRAAIIIKKTEPQTMTSVKKSLSIEGAMVDACITSPSFEFD